jgi:hypothetical protein
MDPSEVIGEKPFWYVLIRVHRAGQAFSRKDVSRLTRNLHGEGTLPTAKLVGTELWALGHVAEMRNEDAKSFMVIDLDGGLSRGLGPGRIRTSWSNGSVPTGNHCRRSSSTIRARPTGFHKLRVGG